MKHYPASGDYLERYEVGDGLVLGIANECGDITAYVRRPDGTRGHAYGGPVYDPPEFANTCDRVEFDRANGREPCWWRGWTCPHDLDLTSAELATAEVLARNVGWMPVTAIDGPAASAGRQG